MSILDRLPSVQGIRSDEPNKALARELAESGDAGAVAELAAGLGARQRRVQGDCIKVLYELGYLRPELIADHVDTFARLLLSRNNRLVWGSMIALACIAPVQPGAVMAHRELIESTMDGGSVITVDAGVRALANLAAANDVYRAKLMPQLLRILATCRPKSVAQYAESVAVAVPEDEAEAYCGALAARLDGISASQAKRVARLLRQFGCEG